MEGFKGLSKIRMIFSALLLGLALTGCAVGIDQATLKTRLAAKEERPVLVDVRMSFEYQTGHLPGAVNIPVYALPFDLAEVPVKARSREVVVYCAHGPRAGLAGFILRLAGFSQVRHLQGDFNGWRRAGLPVVAGAKPGG